MWKWLLGLLLALMMVGCSQFKAQTPEDVQRFQLQVATMVKAAQDMGVQATGVAWMEGGPDLISYKQSIGCGVQVRGVVMVESRPAEATAATDD